MKYAVTRINGPAIPPGEPCFVIRAQDAFALRAIQAYIKLTLDIVSQDMTGELVEHRERIRQWQAGHPVKIPD